MLDDQEVILIITKDFSSSYCYFMPTFSTFKITGQIWFSLLCGQMIQIGYFKL